MKKIEKAKQEIYEVYDDEIDLFDLFQKIWKWKWLTFGIIIIICTSTFFYLKIKPDTYTITSTIKIGKIAGISIEQKSNLENYLSSDEFQIDKSCAIKTTVTALKTNAESPALIEIQSISTSPEQSNKCIEYIIQKFLHRHKVIYEKGLKKINADITSAKPKIILTPEYFLDTYTFPSSISAKPIKPNTPDSKKMPVKMAVAFFASLFLGIFLSFFIDYIVTNIKKSNKVIT